MLRASTLVTCRRSRSAIVVGLAVLLSLHAFTASAQSSAVRLSPSFARPTFAAAPVGDERLFVVERAGLIRVFVDGAILGTPFLDIRDRVAMPPTPFPPGYEGGFLGLVFAPDFAQSGDFYVYYVRDSDPEAGITLESRVSRFTAADPASSDPVDAGGETILFELDQPLLNHNGGTIAIRDGFLYLGLGDGGGGGDPNELAQNDQSPFGKMLRFDLSQQQVPWTPEQWAKGFRNPFRFSFDSGTGDLYIGDVGNSNFEEIDVEPADSAGGLNYGWDVMEGTSCFADGPADPGEPVCNDPSLVLPVHEYETTSNSCAVTGGSVYRGASTSLRGLYFFSDWCAARIWTLRWNPETGLAEEFTDRTDEFPITGGFDLFQPVAIVPDGQGELIVVSLLGSVYRLVPEPGAALLGAAAIAALAALARRERASR